ncbi:ubiquitin-conjugating enzyme E2 J1 isoform X1 [Nelusetta ayraudi]|uniref:ubiquitin-conjugating enzyme E2 J1 isoform X1 n=1 Tax=Nelusetta ayraudi TaxID=303726 RepID=UPI003F71F3B4
MENKYNLKSPAVKRLMKEAAELRDPTEHYHAQPLDDNLFEWHFSVRGPPDSDFDGGVYHGRIVLPPEYPMKPPSIILLTPNGRFEVGKKICLSISGHHPETWQPSWSIRTALLAIIGFMPSKGEGAIGSLDYTPEERKALAKKSLDFCCDACGCSMRCSLLPLTSNSNSRAADREAKELAQQINFKAESNQLVNERRRTQAETAAAAAMARAQASTSAGQEAADSLQAGQTEEAPPAEEEEQQEEQQEDQEEQEQQEEEQPAADPTPVAPGPAPATPGRPLSPRQRRAQRREGAGPRPGLAPPPAQEQESRAGSAALIVLLTLALAALVFRRIYLAQEYKFDYDL